MVARNRKNAKRLLLVIGLALLPGAAGAADFGASKPSFWEWANPSALFGRFWDGLGDLTGLWTNGGSIDPNGGEGTDNGGSIDPNGAESDSGGSIDPHG